MADNLGYTEGSGKSIASDEILGQHHQRVKISVGADGSASDWEGAVTVTGVSTAAKQDTGNTSLASIDGKITAVNTGAVVVSSSALPSGASTSAKQDTGNTSLASIDGKITACNTGAVVVSSVPTDPFGANADAASATGSISAKLRFIASTGIPVTGTVTVGSHAVTIASGGVASGAIASGAVASGAVASGAFASGSVADGAVVTLGAKTDAKSTATDATSITVMQVAKQISASAQLCDASLGIMDDWDNAASDGCSVSGDVAHAATDAGEPVKIGGVAKTANPTAVTDGQRVNAIFDKVGKQIVVGAIRDLKGTQQTSLSNTTSETTIVTAVASTYLDLYGLILANTGATTTKVSIRDDTAGTVRMIIEVPTLETRGFMLPVDSAVPQTATNKNWTAQCASATTALEVTALYVKNV